MGIYRSAFVRHSRSSATDCNKSNTDFLNRRVRRVSCENCRTCPAAFPSLQSTTNKSPPPLSANGHHQSDHQLEFDVVPSLAIISPSIPRTLKASRTDSRTYEESNGTSTIANSPVPSWWPTDCLTCSQAELCRSSLEAIKFKSSSGDGSVTPEAFLASQSSINFQQSVICLIANVPGSPDN